ncbi:uncharacterized protein [Gossypium hirsutum]|uniref:Retrotransposon gag domain-containing protein n=1 Tax=Gossypium hirsutum TaxID=3635 RepID=A0ABM2ZCB5_GOSHI|nr:uncharacterized protein LOC121212141 [Gossypium hirsutum]
MSTRGTRGRSTRGWGRDRRGIRAESFASAMIHNLDTSEMPVSLVTETGGFSLLRDEAYQWWLTVKEGTQPDRLTWDLFKIAYQSKYVGLSYTDPRRHEFLNLTLGDRSVAEYEAEFLRLSRYARGIVTNEYEHCVQFEDGFRDCLRVLITPQRERDFSVLVEKAKIIEEVKCSERQNREKGKVKRDSESTGFGMRPKKKARTDRSVRVGPTVAPAEVAICQLCNRLHPGECWRSTGACLRCGSIEHRVNDCPLRGNQVQAPIVETTQSPRKVKQPSRGKGQARGGNGMGRGQRAPDRDVGPTEARQPALVYAAHRREDGDAPNVIMGTFLVLNVPYVALIDIGFTHSYVACSVSETLGILHESTSSEIFVVSPLDSPLSASDSVGLSVKDVRAVKDFPDIFPEELPRLPSGREVEFGIELILGTAPVSIAPYRIALKELTKLKA